VLFVAQDECYLFNEIIQASTNSVKVTVCEVTLSKEPFLKKLSMTRLQA